jgi:hypothetical protein
MAIDDFLLWLKNNFKYKTGLGNTIRPRRQMTKIRVCWQIDMLCYMYISPFIAVGCDFCDCDRCDTYRDHERQRGQRVEQSLASSGPDIAPTVEVCKLWVLLRESESFERNSISSYFDKLWCSWYSAVASSSLDSAKLRRAHSEGDVSSRMPIVTVLFTFTPVTHTNPPEGSRESWWSMVNWLKLQGTQMHFAAPRCEFVEWVCRFYDVAPYSLVGIYRRFGSKMFT